MLGDNSAGPAGHEGGHGRNVERRDITATGAAGIDQVCVRGVDADHRVAQRPRRAGELVGGLAFCAQPQQ